MTNLAIIIANLIHKSLEAQKIRQNATTALRKLHDQKPPKLPDNTQPGD